MSRANRWVVLIAVVLIVLRGTPSRADIDSNLVLWWDGDIAVASLGDSLVTSGGTVGQVQALRGKGYDLPTDNDFIRRRVPQYLPSPGFSMFVKPRPVTSEATLFNMQVQRENNDGLALSVVIRPAAAGSELVLKAARIYYPGSRWRIVQPGAEHVLTQITTANSGVFHHVTATTASAASVVVFYQGNMVADLTVQDSGNVSNLNNWESPSMEMATDCPTCGK